MSSRAKAEAPRPKGLPSHLAVLCRMLRSPESDRRCAAAMVLAELSPRETPVVEALGEALADDLPALTHYALDALERIGSRAALPYLLPLLERDEKTRERAQRVIAGLGEPAIADVCRELAQAPRDRRRPLIDLLVHLDGRGALAAVLEALLHDEPDHADQVVQRYSARWASLSPEARAERRAVLLNFLSGPAVQGRPWPTSLTLRLLGALGDPASRKAVLGYTRAKHPPQVRRAALHALRRLAPARGHEAEAFEQLAALLGEDDLENVVAPALEALRPIETPAGATALLKGLLDSRHMAVRRFATERLGDLDDPSAATTLVKLLDRDDLREPAQDALRKSPAALPALVRSLKAAETPDAAWLVARLIAARAAELSAGQVRAVAEAAEAAVKKDDGRAEALLHALKACDPERYRHLLLRRGLKLLKGGRADEAARTLAPLDRGAEADPESRYALAVALLKASPKDLNRRVRLGDRALSLFRELLQDGEIPLLQRLTTDKSLETADRFYLGFHFSEGDEAERELGTALLERIVKAEPRTQIARSARNKLALVRRSRPPAED